MGEVVELLDPVEKLSRAIATQVGRTFRCKLYRLPEKSGVRIYRLDASVTGAVLLLMVFAKADNEKWSLSIAIFSPALVSATIGYDVIALAEDSAFPLERLACSVAA